MNEETKELNDAKQIISTIRSKKVPAAVANTAALMLQDIHHGKTWTAEWLSENLQQPVETLAFSLKIAELTELLESDGYHLTSRGKNGREWAAAKLEDTVAVAKGMNRKAMKLLRRSAVFCNAVVDRHGKMLDENERQKIEKQAQIQALRFVMLSRLR